MEQSKPTQLDLFRDYLPRVLRERGMRPNDILTELERVVAPRGANDGTLNLLKCRIQRALDA